MPHASSATSHRSISGRKLAAAAIVVMLTAHATPGWAAKIYRCGNVFQDLPCPEPKAAEQRPIERPAASRDATPCSAAKDVVGRSDCIARTTRDTQTVSVIEAKR